MRAMAIVAMLVSGCSWIMVAGPPAPPVLDVHGAGPPGGDVGIATAPPPTGDCTRQKLAPVVDTVFGSMFAGGAAVTLPLGTALAFSDDDYNQMMGGMFIGASVVYALLAWPFIASARSGYRDVAACRAAYQRAYGSIYPPGTLGAR